MFCGKPWDSFEDDTCSTFSLWLMMTSDDGNYWCDVGGVLNSVHGVKLNIMMSKLTKYLYDRMRSIYLQSALALQCIQIVYNAT